MYSELATSFVMPISGSGWSLLSSAGNWTLRGVKRVFDKTYTWATQHPYATSAFAVCGLCAARFLFKKRVQEQSSQDKGTQEESNATVRTESSKNGMGNKSGVVERIADYVMQARKRAKLRTGQEKIQNGINKLNKLIAFHRSNLPNGFKVKKSVIFALEYRELQHVGNEFDELFRDVSLRLSQQDAGLLQNAQDAVHTIIEDIKSPCDVVDEFRSHVDSQIKELYRRLHELSDVLNACASCQSSEQGISDSADSNAGQNSQENTTGKQNCDNNHTQTGSRQRKPKLSKQEKKQIAEAKNRAKDTRKKNHSKKKNNSKKKKR